MTTRYVGIRHRVKKTADNESHPTELFIIEENSKESKLELKTENDELDWLLGRLPDGMRLATEDEDFSKFPARHVIRKKEKGSENEIVKVPESYIGYQAGDIIGMTLGGSGDRLAYALSRHGDEIGAKVFRIPPASLKAERPEQASDDKAKAADAELLARLVQTKRNELFYEITPRDRDYIAVSEAWRAREFAMKDRMACDQRLRSQVIGRAFVSNEGKYPEGSLEDAYDQLRANDKTSLALYAEEELRNKELAVALSKLDIFNEVFSQIEGCGPMISGRLITAMNQIRRFEVTSDKSVRTKLRQEAQEYLGLARYDEFKGKVERKSDGNEFSHMLAVRTWMRTAGLNDEADAMTEAINNFSKVSKLKRAAMQKTINKVVKFCGVDVAEGGVFRRRRRGERNAYNPLARQALYLLGDQFNRRPASVWGLKLREQKAALRKKHPEPVVGENKKKKYTDGHIHKMAIWRTLTRFVQWLVKEWLRAEHRHLRAMAPTMPPDTEAEDTTGGDAKSEAQSEVSDSAAK